MAIEGMTEMSDPCEPSAMPLPSQVMTAARWRRLPLTRIRAWSSRPSTSASSPSATPAAIVRTGNRRPHHGSAVRDLATCAAAFKPGSENVTS